MSDRPAFWRDPITKPHPHGCLNCNHTITTTFPEDGLIAVGFGFAACLRNGEPVLEEPRLQFDDEGVPIEGQEEEHCPTGADAEALAAADPEHDWQIQLEGPLSGRTYQRQGPNNWVLIEQNMGFA